MVNTVVLKGGAPWGFRLGGGSVDGHPLFITKLNPNSKAHQYGLAVSDRVCSINGHSCSGLYLTEAQQLIKQATHQLILEIDRDTNLPNGGPTHQTSTTISLKPREIPVVNLQSRDDHPPKSPTVINIPVITNPDKQGRRMYERDDPLNHWSLTSTLGRPKVSSRPPHVASTATLPNMKTSKGMSLFLKQQEKLSQLADTGTENGFEKCAFDVHPRLTKRRPIPKHAGYFSEDEGDSFMERRHHWQPQPRRVNRIASVDSSAPKFVHSSLDNRKPVPVITVKGIKRNDDPMKRPETPTEKKMYEPPRSAPPVSDKSFGMFDENFPRKHDRPADHSRSREHDRRDGDWMEKFSRNDEDETELELEKILASLERRKPVEQKYIKDEKIPTEKVVPILISSNYRGSDVQRGEPSETRKHICVPVEHDPGTSKHPPEQRTINRSYSSPGQAFSPRKELFSSSFSSPYFDAESPQRDIDERTSREQRESLRTSNEDQPRDNAGVYNVPIIIGKQQQVNTEPHPTSESFRRLKAQDFGPGLLTTVDSPTSASRDTDRSLNLSVTSTYKPGVWSPGAQPGRLPSEMVERRTEQSSDSSRIPAVWSPGNTFSSIKKEFKPVRLDTQVPKRVTVVKEPFKYEDIPDDDLPPWPQEHAHTHKQTKDFSYEPIDADAYNDLPAHDPKQPPAQKQPTEQFSRSRDFDDTNQLPVSQSPYITLLQKSRDEDANSPTSSLPNDGELPRGVQYLGETEPTPGEKSRGVQYLGSADTIQGDQRHTDSYYATPTVTQVTSKKTVIEQAGKIKDGIGPVDEEGVPLAFRKDVDEKNQRDWYKQMYRSLHRHGRKGSIDSYLDNYQPTYLFPNDKPKMEAKKGDLKNSYDKTKKVEDKKKVEERSQTLRPRMSKDLTHKWSPADARHGNEPYKIQPRSIVDYEPGFSSIAFSQARSDVTMNPPIPKPGQFSQYTVGGGKAHLQANVSNNNSNDDLGTTSYKHVQRGGDIPPRGLQKPVPDRSKVSSQSRNAAPKTSPPDVIAIDNVIDIITRSSPAKIRSVPKHRTTHDTISTGSTPGVLAHTDINGNDKWSPPGDTSPQDMHPPSTNVVNGGYHYPGSDPQRNQLNTERELKRREEDYTYRMQRLDEIFEEDRRRQQPGGQARVDPGGQARIDPGRRHDQFVPSHKAIIPIDRFDAIDTMKPAPKLSVPADRRRGFQIKGKARAIYNFTAQNPNELTFRKGEVIFLHRQIDQNWYEGEKHGTIGILPANYIEILTTIDTAKSAAIQSEGQARAKYPFKAQTSVELDLQKGDTIILLRHVDENWYEGRNGNRQGIFPCAYVEVVREPSTPLVTPAPSVITTPMIVTPESLSPVGFEAPTPPPQPSPSSFVQRPSSAPTYNQSQRSMQQELMSNGFSGYIPINNFSGPSVDGYTDSMSRSFSQPGSQRAWDAKAAVGGFTKQATPPPPAKVKSKVDDDDLALKRYRALYTYRRHNEDELELEEGDEVYVMEKCDDGWYVGTSARTGEFGTFPGNYVHMCS